LPSTEPASATAIAVPIDPYLPLAAKAPDIGSGAATVMSSSAAWATRRMDGAASEAEAIDDN